MTKRLYSSWKLVLVRKFWVGNICNLVIFGCRNRLIEFKWIGGVWTDCVWFYNVWMNSVCTGSIWFDSFWASIGWVSSICDDSYWMSKMWVRDFVGDTNSVDNIWLVGCKLIIIRLIVFIFGWALFELAIGGWKIIWFELTDLPY